MIWNFCIRRPVLTIVMFVVLGIFGIYGFLQMPVQENPDVDFPIVSVNVVLPGAAPAVVELEIIEPLEAEINTIEGLRRLTSSARQEVATIVAEFELWRNIDLATQDVRDAVERARRLLPQDAESPIVRKLEPDAQPIMWIALTGDERWDDVRLTDYAENVLRQQLETVRGVGQIRIGGRRLYAVRVRLDMERLAAYQLTVHDVVRTIQQSNVDIPAGRVEGARREFTIQTRGRFANAAPFNDLIVAHRDGGPVRLADVGKAVDDVRDDRQVARFHGETAVGLGVVRQADANVVDLTRTLRNRLAAIAGAFPPGLTYHISTDASEYVQENIDDLLLTLVLATLLVLLVVLAFLRSARGTLVTMTAIPTSLLIGLALMHVLGFSINVLTMLALILVIGIVIDDAIVVLERSYLHLEQGAEREPAARVGATEMAFPAIANTLALAAVFIPVAFAGGMVGRFFLEFGITVAATVFASTLVALTLTPMLCSRVLRLPERRGRLFQSSERAWQQIESAYASVLDAAFRHRGLTVLIGAIAFGFGLLALANIPGEFAGQEDRSSFMLIFETPQGATFRETDRLARQIETVLANTPEVRHQFLAIGLAQAGPGEPNRGLAFVRLTPWQERDRHQIDIMQALRQRFDEIPDGRVFVTALTPGGFGGAPVEVVLKHPSIDELARQQEAVMAWMRAQPQWYVGVRTNLELNAPQVELTLHRDKAAEMGISLAEISTGLQFLFGTPAISKVEQAANRYDVITDVVGRGRLTPAALRDFYLRTATGELVALETLASVEETIGPSAIHRFNRIRSATISANTPPGIVLGDAVARLEDHLRQTLPPGMDYELAGQAQLFEEAFYNLTIVLVFSVVFIYLVLAAQFESILYPFTIMTALPLATVGAFGSMWALGLPLNVFAFIGIIMLLGLVTKNAILLIDYANVLVARGRTPMEAAQEAGRTRFRPVLMTAISTVLGITPIALGLGAGGEARMPLGVAVASGLLSSTALTLVVIPVVYTLVDGLQTNLVRRWRKMPREVVRS